MPGSTLTFKLSGLFQWSGMFPTQATFIPVAPIPVGEISPVLDMKRHGRNFKQVVILLTNKTGFSIKNDTQAVLGQRNEGNDPKVI